MPIKPSNGVPLSPEKITLPEMPAVYVPERLRLWTRPLDEENERTANEIWEYSYTPAARVAYIRLHRNDFEFHSFGDLMGCVRGRYFAGCASELCNR